MPLLHCRLVLYHCAPGKLIVDINCSCSWMEELSQKGAKITWPREESEQKLNFRFFPFFYPASALFSIYHAASVPRSMKGQGKEMGCFSCHYVCEGFILIQLLNVKDCAEVTLHDPSMAREQIEDKSGLPNTVSQTHATAEPHKAPAVSRAFLQSWWPTGTCWQ